MRVAVPTWERRISPVFDTAGKFTVAEIERGKVVYQFIIPFQELFLPRRAIILKRWRINTLICGGISTYLVNLVAARGIRVVPGIRGDVNEVLKAFCRGDIPSARFVMPGWRGRRRKRYAGGRY